MLPMQPIDLAGKPDLSTTIQGVTETNNAEELSRAGERTTRAAIESSPTRMLIVDREGRIQLVNADLARQLGYRVEEIIGEPIEILVPVEQHARLREHLRSESHPAESRPTTIDLKVHRRRKGGSTFPVDIHLTPLEGNGGPLLIATVNNPTARPADSERLEQSQARLEVTQRIGETGHWEWNLETGEMLCSDQSYRIFGLTPQEIVETYDSFLEFVHPDDRDAVAQSVNSALYEGAVFAVDHRIVRMDGELRWVHQKGEVTRNAAGEPIMMIGVVIDITVRQQLLDQLLQSQKLDAIGRLAGGIAHDLNNALVPILCYTELLREKCDHSMDKEFDEIERGGQLAAVLASRLLALSRPPSLPTRVFDLNESIQPIEILLGQLLCDNVKIRVDLDVRAGAIEMNPGQLEQIVVNLALNASDAMPSGGVLTITTERAKHPDVGVQLHLADTGHGMDEKLLESIFEPFFTTKHSALRMGLGLTTVYGILKQAGATIDVQSRPDQGTRFTLSFPTASRALTANSRAVRSDSRPTGTETVLVIEDDDSIRALIARILTVRGYGVLLASRGAEAMRIARDSSRTVDLVISDIVLPEMTGPEIVEALQRENAGLRILYISGYPNEATPLFGVLDPDDNFLMKPFLPSQLAVRVREILDRTL